MAKKSLIRKNEKRLLLYKSNLKKRLDLLAKAKDVSLSMEDRFFFQSKLSKMKKDTSRVRFRNRCLLTGRPRGNLRKFSVSRIMLRNLASWGQVPGLIKASW